MCSLNSECYPDFFHQEVDLVSLSILCPAPTVTRNTHILILLSFYYYYYFCLLHHVCPNQTAIPPLLAAVRPQEQQPEGILFPQAPTLSQLKQELI